MSQKRQAPYHDLKAPKSWWDLFLALGGRIVLGAALGVLVLTLISLFSSSRADRFESDGVIISAVVTDKRERRSGDNIDYMVTFEFVEREGRREISGEEKVVRSIYRGLEIGERQEIRYLRSDPTTFEFPIGVSQGSAWGVRIAAGVIGAVTLVLFWVKGRRTNAAVLARRDGKLQRARVERVVEEKNSGEGTGEGYLVWRLDDGVRGESLTRPMADFAAIKPGAMVNVYVRDGESYWEGDVGPRPARASAVPKVDG